MTDIGCTIVQYRDALGIRTRGSHPQEIRIRLSDLGALIAEIIDAVPRDAEGTALIDQIITAARLRRPRDRTNAERQRRFRQRRRARQAGVRCGVTETTPA
jgi:hypothetical protein